MWTMPYFVNAQTARLALPLVALTAVLGCAQQPNNPPAPPIVVDAAMQRREFPRSVAYIPNGDTVAGVQRFPFRSNSPEGQRDYPAAAYDIVASLGETIALPFTYLFIPPFAKQVYSSEVIGPTHTAMPPMHAPRAPVNVDGVLVDPDTLEPVQARNSSPR